jgi:Rrf2 family protein
MLSKSSEYAIRALVFIQLQNCKKRRPGVAEISKEIDAPAAFTAKILHLLTKHQLLSSMKGRGGGFFFTEDQSDLSLYEVIIVMEGKSLFTRCGFGLKNCSELNPCPLHEPYTEIREGIVKLVKDETTGSLAQKIRSGQAVLNH